MKKLKSPKLSHGERKALRSDFLSKTGLDEDAPSYFINMLPRYATIMAYSFLLLIVGFTPLAFAAEKSAPGNILYPIKTTINEPIKKAVKVITEPKTTHPKSLEKTYVAPAATTTEDTKNKREEKSPKKSHPVIIKDKSKSVLPNVPAIESLKPTLPINVPSIKINEKEKKKSDNGNEEEQDEKKSSDQEDELLIVPVKVKETIIEKVDDAEKTVEDTVEKIVPKINLSL